MLRRRWAAGRVNLKSKKMIEDTKRGRSRWPPPPNIISVYRTRRNTFIESFYIDLRITVHINVTAILTDLRLHPVLVQLHRHDPGLDLPSPGSGLARQ